MTLRATSAAVDEPTQPCQEVSPYLKCSRAIILKQMSQPGDWMDSCKDLLLSWFMALRKVDGRAIVSPRFILCVVATLAAMLAR